MKGFFRVIFATILLAGMLIIPASAAEDQAVNWGDTNYQKWCQVLLREEILQLTAKPHLQLLFKSQRKIVIISIVFLIS